MFKATVIGAGSTYTPELIEGFIGRRDSLRFDVIALMDIDRERLEIVGGLAKRQLKKGGYKGEVILTDDIDRALDGASFVFAQVRVGRMTARIRDERIPLNYGLLGQETTGAGGFAKALRTIPVIMDVAERMKRLSADGAWLINFSNPSGIIAEAVLNNTDINMIGLCNCPINMVKGVADALGTTEFDYEYVGLNHLSWITSVTLKDGQGAKRGVKTNKKRGSLEYGVNLVAGLAGSAGANAQMKNVPGIDYEPALLKAIPYIPSSYLNYYYAREEQIEKCKNAEKTRGEICLELDEQMLRQYADPKLKIKPPELAQRGGALYSTAALSAADSIAGDKRELHVVAAKNRGAVPFMDDDDVVEVLCELGRNGVTPKPVYVYNDYVKALMRVVKTYEKLTVQAAINGDREAALSALMVHPLIGSYSIAKPLLDVLLEANKEFLPNFFK